MGAPAPSQPAEGGGQGCSCFLQVSVERMGPSPPPTPPPMSEPFWGTVRRKQGRGPTCTALNQAFHVQAETPLTGSDLAVDGDTSQAVMEVRGVNPHTLLSS